jgi:hypothetical protein
MTRDLDVCALLTQENLSKLREVLQDLRPVHRLSGQKLSFLDNPAPDVKVSNLYLGTDFGPVDLLSNILGVGDFESVRANAVEVDLFGRRYRVISLDDLIRAKEALTRDKDHQAVVQLRAIREKLNARAAAPTPPTSDRP